MQKKSGLLSLLPQPKGAVISTTTSKSLIPHVLTQKPNTPTVKKKLPPIPKQAKATEAKTLALDYSDDSDNEDVQNDFFSFNKPVEEPIEDMPLDIDEKLTPKVPSVTAPKEKRNIESYFKQDIAASRVELKSDSQVEYHSGYGLDEGNSNGYNGASESSSTNSNDVVLDDEAVSICLFSYVHKTCV